MERFRAFVAAYLVLRKEDQILLSRRFNTGYQDGKYSLVAGHLDGGETAQQCIVREAVEEIGITLNIDHLNVVHVMHRLAPDREYFDIYVCATEWSGDISNLEADKCDELQWCPMDKLPDNILPEVKFALENIGNNVHYSQFGWTS